MTFSSSINSCRFPIPHISGFPTRWAFQRIIEAPGLQSFIICRIDSRLCTDLPFAVRAQPSVFHPGTVDILRKNLVGLTGHLTMLGHLTTSVRSLNTTGSFNGEMIMLLLISHQLLVSPAPKPIDASGTKDAMPTLPAPTTGRYGKVSPNQQPPFRLLSPSDDGQSQHNSFEVPLPAMAKV